MLVIQAVESEFFLFRISFVTLSDIFFNIESDLILKNDNLFWSSALQLLNDHFFPLIFLTTFGLNFVSF